MKRVLTAAILIPLVLLVVFKGSLLVLTLASALVAGLAAWEFLSLADASGARTPRVSVLAAIALLFLCTYERPEYSTATISALSFALLTICAFSARPDTPAPASPSPDGPGPDGLSRVLLNTGSSVFALLYCGLAMASVPAIAASENGPSLLLFLFFAVWTGDVAALYVGRNFGRRKLAPALSPNKTWEGSVASIAGSLLVTAALYLLASDLTRRGLDWLSYPGSVGRWLALSVLINIAAQLGDLLESAIKRGAQVKDSGTLLPGHGGVLDRIDALLLAAPVLWYALLIQQNF